MIASLPPGVLLVVGGLLVPLIPGLLLRRAFMLALPLAGLWGLLALDPGIYYPLTFLGFELAPVRIDGLSRIFGIIFHIAAFLGVLYALHLRDTVQHVAALVYAGAAIGACFAGDLITLFVFWELTAIASVVLIWANRSEPAFAAGMRYLVIQVTSGVLLLGGALLVVHDTGSVMFERMTLDGLAAWLIFIAFGIKCAFPLLHGWLQDAYPNGTVTGTVFLSAFTTKLAVYALARGFPGTEILIWIGVAMTLFPVLYASIENDLRRVLAYSLNNQLGFMVVGIGIGTELALSGAAAQAFVHVLYKSLLFMAVGAVLLRAGTAKAAALGGLWRSMPLTAIFAIIGASALAGMPFLGGFVAKSLTLGAVGEAGLVVVWLLMMAATAGMILGADIRVPYAAFFAEDRGAEAREAPWNMLAAMAIIAALLLAIGLFPGLLYGLLPYSVDYQPYTPSYLLNQFQLLVFVGLGFAVLVRSRLLPRPRSTINLDVDWVWRVALPALVRGAIAAAAPFRHLVRTRSLLQLERLIDGVFHYHGPDSILARSWPTGTTALWVAALLMLYLLFYYL